MKDVENGAARQEEKRKTTEKVFGVTDGVTKGQVKGNSLFCASP